MPKFLAKKHHKITKAFSCAERKMTVSRKVQVISREIIKPSSPTPHHLRTFKLSLLDQFIPPFYVPVILFYPTNLGLGGGDVKKAEISDRLKKSLSKTLTRFYPLAGRIKDNQSVDCNDEGVDYTEARVNYHLSEILKRPEIHILNQLLPFSNQSANSYAGGVQLAVRVNFFDCGGMAVAVHISHKLADGSTMSTFLNGWAATARENSEEIGPRFDSASLFPPIDFAGFKPNAGIAIEKLVTKRFVFNATRIAALRVKVAGSTCAVQPTRVEAVSALVWKCVIEAASVESKTPPVLSVATHAVNLRGKMVPPLPGNSFGNLFRMGVAPVAVKKGLELSGLVGQLRDSIRKIDGDYVKKLQGENGISTINDNTNELRELLSKGEVQFCRFSSWCRLPFYEADFGWGKPIWVSTSSVNFKNAVVLMDTRWGDGIETWVTMEDQDMAKFESDPELLPFVSSP